MMSQQGLVADGLGFGECRCDGLIDTLESEGNFWEACTSDSDVKHLEKVLPSLMEFELQQLLYERQGAKVLRMRRKLNSQLLAVKVTEMPQKNSSAALHLSYETQFYRQVQQTKVSYLTSINKHFLDADYYVRVMEYACGGDITQYVPSTIDDSTKIKKAQHLLTVKNVLWQVVQGLEEVHAQGYVYRDLKPSNILVTHTGRAKLCDFGLVAPLDIIDASICGTPDYMPPQRLSSKRKTAPIDTSIDVWSLGVLAFELLMGLTPYYYEDEDIEGLLQSMYGGYAAFDEDYPSYCRHFIFNMLQTNPRKRLTLPQIKKHQFFKDVQQVSLLKSNCKCFTNSCSRQ